MNVQNLSAVTLVAVLAVAAFVLGLALGFLVTAVLGVVL